MLHLHVIGEFTRDCIAIRVSHRLRSTDLFIRRGIPGHDTPDHVMGPGN